MGQWKKGTISGLNIWPSRNKAEQGMLARTVITKRQRVWEGIESCCVASFPWTFCGPYTHHTFRLRAVDTPSNVYFYHTWRSSQIFFSQDSKIHYNVWSDLTIQIWFFRHIYPDGVINILWESSSFSSVEDSLISVPPFGWLALRAQNRTSPIHRLRTGFI